MKSYWYYNFYLKKMLRNKKYLTKSSVHMEFRVQIEILLHATPESMSTSHLVDNGRINL